MPALKKIHFLQFAASVLLALMLAIQGVQLLHHHPGTVSSKQASKGLFVSSGYQPAHHCAICTFHITREALTGSCHFSFRVVRVVAAIHAFYAAPRYEARVTGARLRGPPATTQS